MIRTKYVCAAVVIAALAGFSLPAMAEGNAPAVTLGVVDMSKVLQTTDAAKSIFSALEDKRKEFQTQIAKEENVLRSSEQDIVKQKDKLSKDDFDSKRKGFEQKVLEGQKMVQEKKHLLDQAFNSSMNKLRGEAAKIVADVAKEKGFSAVLTQESVMLSVPEMDITAEVISRLNSKVKKIPVDWSAAKTEKKAG